MFSFFYRLVRPRCPICDGVGGGTDPYPSSEWYQCECCNHSGENETGRVWRWRLWQFNYRNWKLDRWIARQIKAEHDAQ